MLAKLTAIGRMTRDPEVRTISTARGNQNVADFTLACDIYKDHTEFLRFSAWGKLADVVGSYGSKGRLVYVEATPQTDSYDTERDGVTTNVRSLRFRVDTFRFLDFKAATDAEPAEDDVVF